MSSQRGLTHLTQLSITLERLRVCTSRPDQEDKMQHRMLSLSVDQRPPGNSSPKEDVGRERL